MNYKGRYKIFDCSHIQTYSIKGRKNKCSIKDFVDLEKLVKKEILFPKDEIRDVAKAIVDAYKDKKPVIILTGAHSIKNGLSPIFLDWMKRGVISLIGTNGAGVIHDFEFGIIGETSEDVRGVLGRGEFGMGFETCCYINQALIEGNKLKLGFGESIGKLYWDKKFRKRVIDNALSGEKAPEKYIRPYDGFKYLESSLVATAYRLKIPFTVNATVGTDITDQHYNFDGEAKGGASGRDFLIFTEAVSKLTAGGVILNIGTAVTGPEVLLKAVSMVANIGKVPNKIICADFDLRPLSPDNEARNDSKYHYYFRDQKSVATRIPKVFGGKGYYIEGDQRLTLPSLYQYFLRFL